MTAIAAQVEQAQQEALRVVEVSKRFGMVQALNRVHLSVRRGEVVALVGDNGAGKSTLVKIISGVISPDEGQLFLDGKAARVASPNAAAALGIRTVHQDLALADNLDVVENLFLGRELVHSVGPFRWVDFATMQRRTRDALDELKIGTISDLRTPVGALSGGQRQTVAVARATLENCTIVLLDEPTASLGLRETRHVLDLVHQLRNQGVAIVVVSHNIRQIFELADRIVVLRLGEVAAVFEKTETTPEEVVRAIIGRKRA